MMSDFTRMWDSQLGMVRKGNNHIEKYPEDFRQIRSSPHPERTKEREMDNEGINKLVLANVAEPSQ